jgi:Na+/H+-dicarboxylate symporter
MKWPGVNTQILIGAGLGVAIGLAVGTLEPDATLRRVAIYSSQLVGGFFIDLLKMILVPLLFSSIVVGVASLQAHQQMHRVWVTTLVFFMCSSSIAIGLALLAAHVFQPGAGLHLSMFETASHAVPASQMGVGDFMLQFLHGLFMNPFAALAQGNVIAVVIFALMLGVALVMGGERYKNILALFHEFLEITMRIVGWIMYLAPWGIMALLIKLVATQDASLFGTLGHFMFVVSGTTLFHGLVVLPLILYVITRVTPWTFFKGAREALVTAFATSSSSATMPVTLRCTEKNLKVPQQITGFVVPLGATLNMDGTALYEAAAALFIANLAGVELTLAQQLIVCVTAMIAATGAPGIPSAGMVTMVMVLQSVGLPAEAIAILLPIDRLLDTLRTTVNVQGDMIGSLIVNQIANKP